MRGATHVLGFALLAGEVHGYSDTLKNISHLVTPIAPSALKDSRKKPTSIGDAIFRAPRVLTGEQD
ncbi:hypothetical protein [Sphingomonas sp. ID0503]|uniref:hypothetical protein n=1 Tax=Sphingomonas sp. ID0503 TaxID=3399691 RepID=UPI003AFA0D64